ncbi:RNA polymerase II associated protein 1 [Chamberlinius hualienensis]
MQNGVNKCKQEAKKVKFDIDLDTTNTVNFGEGVKIMDKDTRNVKTNFPTIKAVSFPKVFKVKDTADLAKNPDGKSIGSLFSRHLKFERASHLNKNTAQSSSKITTPKVTPMEVDLKHTLPQFSDADIRSKSVIVDGSGLTKDETKETIAKEIHEENLKKIGEMSNEEITQARQELMKNLDPSILEFLKSKRKPKAKLASRVPTKAIPSTSILNEAENMEVDDYSKTTSPSQDLKEEELPIQPTVAKKWLHMDKVENDKLQWMTNLPKVDGKTGGTARFDFDGNVILNCTDISVREGLHHHGEEPELPGYTLEELLRLSQSSMPSQKVLALSTLSKLFAKIHEGYYDELLSRPLLPDIAVGPIIVLFRAALDDNTSQCLTASVAIIHSLIVLVPDELSLDETFLWHKGDTQPFCQAEIKEKEKSLKTEEDPKEQELSDISLLELDIIKGLIRMDVLPRLRYIIEVLRPSAPVVIQILEIIFKLARHSVESALSVMKTPRLLNVIFEEFCVASWSNNVDNQLQDGKFTSIYGIPTYQAIKIIRILASSDRQLASELLSSYSIMNSLLSYLSVGYQDLLLPSKEAMLLCLESLRTWQVFLRYKLAVNNYEEFFPIIFRQLSAFQNICIGVDTKNHSYDCDYAASWLKLMSSVIKLTLPTTEAPILADGITESADDVLDWELVAHIIDIAELCLQKWLWEMSIYGETTRSGSRLLATSLNFVATFYDTWSKQPNVDHSVIHNRIKKLYENPILPFLSSKEFTKLVGDLRRYSTFKDSSHCSNNRNTSNLPSLNAVQWGGTVISILDRKSPFPVLIDLLRTLFIMIKLNTQLADEAVSNLLENPTVLSYLKTITSFDSTCISGHWFSRFETYFMYYLLSICELKKCSHMSLYHNVALKLLHLMQSGDEFLAEKILQRFIFNPDFIEELNEASLLVENLKIEENLQKRNLLEVERVSQSKLLIETGQVLSNIGQIYQVLLNQILSDRRRSKSKRIDSLFVLQYQVPLVPRDFFYLPLIIKYRGQIKQNPSPLDLQLVSSVNDQTAIYCLQWCHLIDRFQRNTENASKERFVYLSMAFLISSDFFLESEQRRYLEGCYQQMAQKNELNNINLNTSVENGSYNDFFIQLLDQYEAMSYGDHLFGLVILLSMQRCHPIEQRGAVWTERTNALAIINVSLKELLIPLQSYLQPIEDDDNLLASYFKAVLDGRVSWKRNPVLYLIAVHHLHHFLFDGNINHERLRQNMIQKLLDTPNKILSNHLQCYTEPDVNSELGFICCENPSVLVIDIFNKYRNR